MVAVAAATLAATAVRPNVSLDVDQVYLDRSPPDVLAHLRERLARSADVIADSGERAVYRFCGKAGRFSYVTIELITFEPAAISFEHLRGPFATCNERFELSPTVTGSRLTHERHVHLARRPVELALRHAGCQASL